MTYDFLKKAVCGMHLKNMNEGLLQKQESYGTPPTPSMTG